MKLPRFISRLLQREPTPRPIVNRYTIEKANHPGMTTVSAHVRKKPGKPEQYVTTHSVLARELGREWKAQ